MGGTLEVALPLDPEPFMPLRTFSGVVCCESNSGDAGGERYTFGKGRRGACGSTGL
jgi:hypothetical protein